MTFSVRQENTNPGLGRRWFVALLASRKNAGGLYVSIPGMVRRGESAQVLFYAGATSSIACASEPKHATLF